MELTTRRWRGPAQAELGKRSDTVIERVITASAHNKPLVFFFTVLALAGGLYGLLKAPVDAIPDLSEVQVIISTDWEGRSPDLVEDQVTYPISTRFTAAPKVKFVRGESMFGKSFVYVIFEDGTDLYWARARVVESLNVLKGSLPEGVDPRVGPDATSVGWVYEYALVDETGQHDLAELRSLQDWRLRYALESVKGVAEIAPVGGFVKEYEVDLDPIELAAYKLPLAEVVNAIRMSNGDVGGKLLEISTAEYYVRGRGYVRRIEDIENVLLKVVDGTPVLVKNVGTVHLGGEARRGLADLDGRGEVVGGIVVMRHGLNALEVIGGIKKKIKEIEGSLPKGVRIVPTYDRSELIRKAIHTLREKLIEESLVVAVVCFVFLWHVRSALVAIITLPVAIIASFLPMHWLGLTSNIMSLGGIAIAIGAMVDAAIIMVENSHRALERFRAERGRHPDAAERVHTIIEAAKAVGRPLFFSLLVIAVSFAPVFSLTSQEGRLFAPLAFTKTFAMFYAAMLSITLVPVLMLLLVRGRIAPEAANPVNRFLVRAYQPCLNFVLRFPRFSILAALFALAATYFPYARLGREFMPPLNEGALLYMPSSVPGISIQEAARILRLQDEMLAKVPEIDRVFGKAGQAGTATDPAPLGMFETLITLKPPEQWRRGMTWERLVADLNELIRTPGMANVWWMPIQTRTEMLTTGFRSMLGIKVFAADLQQIESLAADIQNALADFPNTRSVFAERANRGYYLDFEVNREAAARYGLRIADVNEVIETAVGGKKIGTTVEGRERYPISVRYARDFRDDLDALKRVLIPAPAAHSGRGVGNSAAVPMEAAQVASSPAKEPSIPLIPISLLANISYKTGPASIRSENGQPVGYVFVDISGHDLERYVHDATQRLNERVNFPAGAYVEWTGQFEHLQRAFRRLRLVVPLTLLIILVLLYRNTGSMMRTAIILLAVPFSLIGAFWALYLLGYNLSAAVWVGIIALAGLDAETGVVMLLYLDQAWQEAVARGRTNSLLDLHVAVKEGALQRLRPKIMTVCAILFGLLPILWAPATQAGADVMKRIATPMIGGVATSAILELLLYPVIFVFWKKHKLPGLGKSQQELGSNSSELELSSPQRVRV
jgi:Cu(I)/Ag(I) efflux system membrane protein CusA/SilA